VKRFGKWHLAFFVFLMLYTAILLLYLDYAPIQWDETPHLIGGLMLSRGNLHQYLQDFAFYPPLFDITIAIYYTVLGSSVFSARLVSVTRLHNNVQAGTDRNHDDVLFFRLTVPVLLLDTHRQQQTAHSNWINSGFGVHSQIPSSFQWCSYVGGHILAL